MKRKLPIVFSLLLLEAILFNQVALQYFHYNHDPSQHHVKNEQVQLQKYKEHCKICSLETLYHLFFEASSSFHFQQPETAIVRLPDVDEVVSSIFISQGRAPPVI